MDKTSKPVPRPKPPLGARIKDALVTAVVALFMWAAPLVLLLASLVYMPLYRTSLKPVEFTVDHRERVVNSSGDSVNSYYLIWSKEGEVFCVTDSWTFWSFDSSDRYGKLKEGVRVTAHVAGWRVPFLSWYRNVIRIDSVSAPR